MNKYIYQLHTLKAQSSKQNDVNQIHILKIEKIMVTKIKNNIENQGHTYLVH